MKYNRSQLAWLSYDFANSAFHLLIPTVLFPLYFKKVLFTNAVASDMYWSMVVSIPVVICGIMSPFIGAFLDKHKAKRIFFITVTIVTIILSAILGLLSPKSPMLPVLIFSLSLLFFNLSQFSYNSFLPSQKSGRGTAWLSGLAWGVGYLGGIICMIPVFLIIKGVELPEAYPQYQFAFLVVSAFYLVFSLPSLLFLTDTQELSSHDNIAGVSPIKKVMKTLRDWHKHRDLFLFLFALYLVNDGLATLVFFTSIFASETLGMGINEIMLAFLVVQVVAIPGTIFLSWVSEKFGYLKVFSGTIAVWIVIAFLFQVISSATHLYALAVLVGLVIGTTPALGRAIVSSYLTDIKESGEIFGFHVLVSRVSAIGGPLLFGIVSTISGSQRIGLSTLVVFFVGALLILTRINTTHLETKA